MARLGVWRGASVMLLALGAMCWLGAVARDDRIDWSEENRAFRRAVERNDIREVQLLIHDRFPAYRNVIRRQPPGKALLLGSSVGDISLVRSLVERGTDPNVPSTEYCWALLGELRTTGVTPLMLAAEYDHPAVVDALLAHGARVNAQDMFGETPLMKAAMCGTTGIMRTLLQHGAAVDQRDRRGCTALYHAAGPMPVNVLLRHGADVNWRPKKAYGNPIGGWRSALHWSAERGDAETVSLLLRSGADVTLRDGEGHTALDIARAEHHRDVERLLEHAEESH